MRVAKPALEIVREYAAERGCTRFDEPRSRFIAPDRSRAIRIREVQIDRIYIFDTAAGISVLPREGRPHRIKPEVSQSMETDGGGEGRPQHKALPEQGERGMKSMTLTGPMQLCLGWESMSRRVE